MNQDVEVSEQFFEATQENVAQDFAVLQEGEPVARAYSEEDLKKVREQEKSKLYPQIESLKE